MSSASGEKASEETCAMDAMDDDAAETSCSNRNHHEGACGDAQRPEFEDGVEESVGGGRTSSSASSDSTVAVNCHSYPTEVVVHGRKVQKVRVLFSPFPPRMSTTSGQESSHAGHPVRRRVASVDRKLGSGDSVGQRFRRFRSSGSTVAQATDDGETVPLSQEESSGCFQESEISVGEQTTLGFAGPVDHVMLEQGGELHGTVEAKMKQEIQNGITFLQERLGGLIRMNFQLRRNLEREMRNCEGLREMIAMTETRLKMAEMENCELKQELDSKEKEVMRFGEQTKDEWQTRIRLEETLIELKRDKDLEVASLNELLDAKSAEIRNLEAELRNRKQTNEKENKNSREETVELVARVNMLEETLLHLQREKEKVEQVATGLKKELETWKTKYESSCHDLDLQIGRFQALKKSYADLQEENQRLAKTTQRVLRDPHVSGPSTLESIRIIDLPEQAKSGGSLQSQHPGHTTLTSSGSKLAAARESRIATQSRKKSQDSAGSDHSFSLPPVQKFNK